MTQLCQFRLVRIFGAFEIISEATRHLRDALQMLMFDKDLLELILWMFHPTYLGGMPRLLAVLAWCAVEFDLRGFEFGKGDGCSECWTTKLKLVMRVCVAKVRFVVHTVAYLPSVPFEAAQQGVFTDVAPCTVFDSDFGSVALQVVKEIPPYFFAALCTEISVVYAHVDP